MNYFRRLLDSKDKASMKRFTILIALTMYAFTNCIALFINKTLLNVQLLSQFVEFNFYIIAIGIFGLSVDKIGDALIERAKAAAAATILGPSPAVENVENVEGDVLSGNFDKPKAPKPSKGKKEVGDELISDEEEDMKIIRKGLTDSLKSEE